MPLRQGELLECFQWNASYDRHALADEMADVLSYLMMLADKTGIDLLAELRRKVAENARKYPVEQCRSRSDKYTAYRQMHAAGTQDKEDTGA